MQAIEKYATRRAKKREACKQRMTHAKAGIILVHVLAVGLKMIEVRYRHHPWPFTKIPISCAASNLTRKSTALFGEHCKSLPPLDTF